MPTRATLAAAMTFLLVPPALSAQNSAYGVLGIGFPSAPYSVLARSMAGGNSATDPLSFLNPGAVGLVRVLSAETATMQEFRNFSIGGVSAGGLGQNRFPFISVSAPLGPQFAYALSVNQYAERTYDLTTTSTVTLRGLPVGVTDRAASTGGIVDVRATVAVAGSPRLAAGLAGHLLSGSAKVNTTRSFSDPSYRPFTETVDASFRGFGVSAGVLATVSPTLHLGGSLRVNTRLNRTIADQSVGRVTLPVTIAGGADFRPSPLFRVAGTVAWRSWSGADADVVASGARAFNTLDAGVGVDVGGAPGGPPVPVRVGVRYATLPFSPTAQQPHELAFSTGSALSLSGGRARLEGALERIMRSGAGVSEKSWLVTVGFVIRP